MDYRLLFIIKFSRQKVYNDLVVLLSVELFTKVV